MFASLYNISNQNYEYNIFDPAKHKITIVRPIPSGSLGETDVLVHSNTRHL